MSQERGKGGQKNQKHKKTNLLMFSTWQVELREKLKQSTNCVCWSEVNVNFCEKPDRCRVNGLPTYRIQLSTDGGRMGVFFWVAFGSVCLCECVCQRVQERGRLGGQIWEKWQRVKRGVFIYPAGEPRENSYSRLQGGKAVWGSSATCCICMCMQ